MPTNLNKMADGEDTSDVTDIEHLEHHLEHDHAPKILVPTALDSLLPEVKQRWIAQEQAKKAGYDDNGGLVHLHAHTLFSTLDGIASPKQYIQCAKAFNMSAIAITDHGSLAGLADAYFEAKIINQLSDNKIKLIAGIEAYINEYHYIIPAAKAAGMKIAEYITTRPELSTIPDVMSRIRRNRHMIILAKNEVGFKNLLHLTTDSWKDGFYYKPRIWLSRLKQYREGLIILSGCLNGPINFELMSAVTAKNAGNTQLANWHVAEARRWVRELKDAFAEDFYYEIQMPGPDIKAGYQVLKLSLKIAKEFNVPTVLTGDSHYLDKRDFEVQRAMMAIDQDTTIDDPNMFMIDTCEGYMKSRAEFLQTYHTQNYQSFASEADIRSAMDTSVSIAEKCEGFKPNSDPKLPNIEDADEKLRDLVINALRDKGLHKKTKKYHIDGRDVTYLEQVKLELKRIREKLFSSYFLITRELVQFSRNSGWDVGPARGSAGGSLVCYLIGIHEMDPMQWGLSFDRFMSESRGGYMLKLKME